MPGATLTTQEASLKEDYLPVIREQLNDATDPVFAQFVENASPVQWYGSQWVASAHFGRSAGVGSRFESDDLPEADNQEDARLTGTTPIHEGTIGFTLALMKATESDRGAWVPAATREMERISVDLRHQLATQFHRGTAVTATIADGSSELNCSGFATSTLRSLYRRQRVDLVKSSDNTFVTRSARITAIDLVNKKITLDFTNTSGGSLTVYVVNAGDWGADTTVSGADQKRQLTALGTVIDDTATLHGVDPATIGEWKSYVKGSVGAISEKKVTDAIDAALLNSGMQVDIVTSPFDLHSALAAELKAAHRYNDTVALRGGWSGIKLTTPEGDVAVVRSRYNLDGTVYGVCTEHMFKAEQWGWEWLDQSGSILRQVGRKPKFEASLTSSFDIGTDKRNCHFKLTGVTA